MNLQLDAISYTNRYRLIPATYKMTFAMFLCLITYVSHIEVQLIILIGVYFFLKVGIKVSGRFLLKWTLIPSLFLFTSLPALMIEVTKVSPMPSELLVSITTINNWHIFLSKSGFEFAYRVMIRALAMFSCVLALVLTTPFSDILHTLHKARVPSVLLDIFVSMYRFIFIFLQFANELYQVVKSRGGNITLRRALYSTGLVIFQLFFKTFEKYKKMTMVIESRGFTDQLYFGQETQGEISKKLIGVSILIFGILLGLEWWCRSN